MCHFSDVHSSEILGRLSEYIRTACLWVSKGLKLLTKVLHVAKVVTVAAKHFCTALVPEAVRAGALLPS